jgi:lipid A 3-O-deacylase
VKRALLLPLLLLALCPAGAWGEEAVPTRFAAAAIGGHAYDPETIDFVLLSGVALFDYDRIWPHRAPAPLRFKVEGSLGGTVEGRQRGIAAANIFALYYLDRWRTAGLRPYGEAGIGLIYTDFQVHHQGLRINFNPQAGIGAEFGKHGFAALRLHHLSNGNLHHDNRGINAVLLQAGRYF